MSEKVSDLASEQASECPSGISLDLKPYFLTVCHSEDDILLSFLKKKLKKLQ